MHIRQPQFSALLKTTVLILLLASVARAADPVPDVNIPYQKFTLKNGLTVLFHEDHKAPIVAVNIWYHVGSKNEKPGKSGFAHLFEHLMFNGSENFNDDYFQALERVGATDLNGTTNEDRTNYFQNVPTSALDLALWMESDRMGHLLGAIDQKKLDEQRGVVQNEKRQGENEPYGVVYELMTKSTFPAGHPYSWTVIGSMEDLNAASLEDAKEWFRTYYGPSNAVLAIAGDIDFETAKQKVERYFGDIPPGPPVAKHETWVAKRSGTQRQTVQDRVPQARVYKVWNIPPMGTAQTDYLDLVSDVLSRGKTSRLYKRLVYDDQIATNVSAYLDMREIASQFVIEATARPGEDLAKVEKALDEELARFLKDGPTATELQRVKAEYAATFIRGSERIGGFGGKTDILARNQVYFDDPGYYKVTLKRVREATAQNLLTTAREWLSDGVYVLTVHPFAEYAPVASDVDRKQLPATGTPVKPSFPDMTKRTLANGLKVVLARRDAVPVVNFRLMIDAGYAADQFAQPGTANLAMSMLDEGTKSRTSLQINDELAMLGAQLGSGSNLDMSSVGLSALKANLDASLDIFADVVLNPSFPEADFNRLQKQQLAGIQREKATPIQMALRIFPAILYGKGHAYGNPLTGSGTEASVAKLTRQDLMKFHQTWFKPNNATLIVVGPVTMDEIAPKLEKLFKGWKGGDTPKKNISPVGQRQASAVFIMDRPGSMQSVILAGHVAPPRANPREIAIESMNNILGGTFTSRVNMNLREDKHWSYGAQTLLLGARGERPFIVYAPVQTDKTREAMEEISKELSGIRGEKPATPEELAKVQNSQTLELPGSWETMDAVARSIGDIVQYGLPEDYFRTYPDKVKALTLDDIGGAAKEVIHADKLVWVVVGDREKIEAGIRELGFGEVKLIDGDGNILEQGKVLKSER